MPTNPDGSASDATTAALMGMSAPAPAVTPPAANTQISPPPVSNSQPLPAPVADPAVVKPATTATPTSPAPAQSGPSETVISDEQLLNAVGIAEKPEMKISRLEKERAAEGKENRRLTEYFKKAKELLEEQGVSIVEDDQKLPAGLLPTKKYTKDVGELNVQFKDLPEKTQELFVENPQKAIDFLMDKAKRSLTKVIPTTEQAPIPSVSPEKHEEMLSFLAEAKCETGDLQFPGLAKNRRIIEKVLNAPNADKDILDFYRQAPSKALEFLHLRFEHAKSYILKQQAKAVQAALAKAQAAESNPTNAPTGGGTASIGTASSTGNAYTDDLLKQMQALRAERDRK